MRNVQNQNLNGATKNLDVKIQEKDFLDLFVLHEQKTQNLGETCNQSRMETDDDLSIGGDGPCPVCKKPIPKLTCCGIENIRLVCCGKLTCHKRMVWQRHLRSVILTNAHCARNRLCTPTAKNFMTEPWSTSWMEMLGHINPTPVFLRIERMNMKHWLVWTQIPFQKKV